MKCFVITYQFTEYVRVPDGPMETKFSHTEVSRATKRIVAPCREHAEIEVRRPRAKDPAFHILSCEEFEIDAIVDVQRRLER